MFLDLVSLFSFISILCTSKNSCIHGRYPVYTFVYNVYKNSITPLFGQVDIVDTGVYNVDDSALNVRGVVSNTSQVRSTYCAVTQDSCSKEMIQEGPRCLLENPYAYDAL